MPRSAVAAEVTRSRALRLGRTTARPARSGPPAGLGDALRRSSRASERRSRRPPIPGGCGCSSPPSRPARSSRRSCAPRACRGMPPPTTGSSPRRSASAPPRGGHPRSSPPPRTACARRWAIRARASTRSRSCCVRFTASGVLVESTSRWELAEQRHPVIEPLLEYKKLSRLQSANGWTWLAEWVQDGRFRPVYVPGRRRHRPLGVVGRRGAAAAAAAARGRAGRSRLACSIVADVAQLEPRVLAAMSGDRALADAARGQRPVRRHRRQRRRRHAAGGEDRDPRGDVRRDDGGVGAARAAPAAHLSARHGPRRRGGAHRRGRRARLDLARPHLARRRPRAGRRRSPARRRPRPPARTRPAHAARRGIAAGSRATSSCRARPRSGRSRGSPTCARGSPRCRRSRRRMPPTDPGPVFARRPHLAFFLHDEVIVHAPAALRRGGGAGGAGCRGLGRAAAVRRLPDRLPARRADRAVRRSRTDAEPAPRCHG